MNTSQTTSTTRSNEFFIGKILDSLRNLQISRYQGWNASSDHVLQYCEQQVRDNVGRILDNDGYLQSLSSTCLDIATDTTQGYNFRNTTSSILVFLANSVLHCPDRSSQHNDYLSALSKLLMAGCRVVEQVTLILNFPPTCSPMPPIEGVLNSIAMVAAPIDTPALAPFWLRLALDPRTSGMLVNYGRILEVIVGIAMDSLSTDEHRQQAVQTLLALCQNPCNRRIMAHQPGVLTSLIQYVRESDVPSKVSGATRDAMKQQILLVAKAL